MTPKNYQPVEKIKGDVSKGIILICDHATNNLPEEYGKLGLSEQELMGHIAYDIGVADLTRLLSDRLELPAVLSNFSRLLIDPNRGEDDPTLVMRLSDGVVIPGNKNVDANEIDRRKENFYKPYHDAIRSTIKNCTNEGTAPVILSIHSFTPNWRGQARVWHAGVLWDRDPRLAKYLMEALATDRSLIVGDNEPYSGALRNDTLYKHGSMGGFAHALLEIRQDLLSSQNGIEEWGEKLLAILSETDVLREFQKIEHFGSNS